MPGTLIGQWKQEVNKHFAAKTGPTGRQAGEEAVVEEEEAAMEQKNTSGTTA
jgi:hypothetical protein